MRAIPFLVVLLWAGCTPQTATVTGTTSTGSPVVGVPSGTTTTGTTTGTPTGTTPPPPEFDCATIPTQPVAVNQLGAPRGYHDVAFTTDGRIIGIDEGWVNNDLIAVDPYDNVEVLVPDLGITQQMVWLPDGDLAIASDRTGAIIRLDAQNNVSVIAPNIGAYGLIMGPDGYLWAANYSAVQRIDIATGATQVVLGSIPRGQPRVINFNRDFTRLYIGTLFGNGDIFYVDLDASYNPVGSVQVLASGVGDGSYHDGLGVDICGYLYVPDYGTSALYRISPSGQQVQALYDTSLSLYGHGLEWGNGVGPWRTDAIYLPRPYGSHQVTELVIGIPTEWDGVVVNAPSP